MHRRLAWPSVKSMACWWSILRLNVGAGDSKYNTRKIGPLEGKNKTLFQRRLILELTVWVRSYAAGNTHAMVWWDGRRLGTSAVGEVRVSLTMDLIKKLFQGLFEDGDGIEIKAAGEGGEVLTAKLGSLQSGR